MDIKTNSHQTTIRKRPLIFLDTETTGLEVQKNELIEIGAIKTTPNKPFKVLDQMNVKIKPQHLENADKVALKIVGYSSEEWKEALSLEKALNALDEFAKDGVLVGYNVNFDWAVLDRAYFSLGRQDPFYYHRLDVMSIAYAKLFSKRKIKRFSLGEIVKYLGVKEENKHRALGDAWMTYQIFKKLVNLK